MASLTRDGLLVSPPDPEASPRVLSKTVDEQLMNNSGYIALRPPPEVERWGRHHSESGIAEVRAFGYGPPM